MKAIITSVSFKKERDTNFGKRYDFTVKYLLENGSERTATYSSAKKDQEVFLSGVETEFTETSREYQGTTYYDVKPVTKNTYSQGGRAIKREQSRYSGFSLSYAKDLVVCGRVELKDLFVLSEKMFDHMVALDKKLEA